MAISLGCAKSATNKEVAEGIPKNAVAIEVYTAMDQTKLFETVQQMLVNEGFLFEEEDVNSGMLVTGFSDIKQDTQMQINVSVQGADGGSMAKFWGQWMMTDSYAGIMGDPTPTPEEATWVNTGRRTIAFGYMAELANELDHTRIDYITKK